MRSILTPLLLLTLLGGARPLLAGPPKVSCTMIHNPIIQYEKDQKTSHEVDDWTIDCTITINGQRIFAGPLPVGHPASLEDATLAFEEFRKKKAPKIVAEWEKGKK